MIDKKTWNREFARLLRDEMFKKNVSEIRLAREAGVTQASISKYTSGITSPNGYTLSRIAEALNCEVGVLIPDRNVR